MHLPPGAPVSPHFTIEESPTAGRGVYAATSISKGTQILSAVDLGTHVILREYRREVCGYCFAYDRGKSLKLRDATHGFSFCSEACEASWKTAQEQSLEAWAAVEHLVKSRPKRDVDMVDINASKPTSAEIAAAWQAIEHQAALIIEARKGGSSKQHRKAVQQAISRPVSADTPPLQLCVALVRYTTPETWQTVLSLASDPCPYKSAYELQDHINSYLRLLATLPVPLLAFTSPEGSFAELARGSWNCFGIRSLDDGGSEFFGYGLWPSASYFNHSCQPNVGKQRIGRSWVFTASRDIASGEELCITYLGGDEKALDRPSRMEKLKQTWGFDCGCERCSEKNNQC
ncbi:hypothetical protein BX600DRAFT_476855 [Xylariales sp. PMI_506]|nr:hypothetical protein BX600DRAFT_476855 [Xylariales sp. PMI_506]